MLDSGGMTESEDRPPTLASLRARRGKSRSGRRSSSPGPSHDSTRDSSLDSIGQGGLFSGLPEDAPARDDQKAQTAQTAQASAVREEPASSSEKARHKTVPTAAVPISAAATERRIW